MSEIVEDMRASLKCALNNSAGLMPKETLHWIECAKEECELWIRELETGAHPKDFVFVNHEEI